MKSKKHSSSTLNLKQIFNSLKTLSVVDASPLFETNMPGWFTHPTMSIVKDARNFEQYGYFAQTLVMSEHTGSHVDAPAHAIESMAKATIDTYPVDMLIGISKKYDLTKYNLKPAQTIQLKTIKEIERKKKFTLEKDDIVLLQTGWDKYYKPKAKNREEREWWGRNMPGLSPAVCRYFEETGVKAVGCDTAGCDERVINGKLLSSPGHKKYFLPRHIFIIECLQDLAKAPTVGIFVALPLKIKGGSGSPIRPIIFG